MPRVGQFAPDYLGQFPQDYLGQFHRNLQDNRKCGSCYPKCNEWEGVLQTDFSQPGAGVSSPEMPRHLACYSRTYPIV